MKRNPWGIEAYRFTCLTCRGMILMANAISDHTRARHKVVVESRRSVRRKGNPRRLSRARFAHQRTGSPRRFDPRSFRTVRRGRHRVVVACPRGYYHSGRCSRGTHAQAVLHPNPTYYVRRGAPTLPASLAKPWAKLHTAERVLILKMMGRETFYLDHIKRRSRRVFDLELGGKRGGYKFSSWLPLHAINALTDWTEDPVARMSDHPQMAREGDWSAIRDTSYRKIWAIFNRHVVERLAQIPMAARNRARRTARVVSIGMQSRPGGKPAIELFNLVEDIPEHPAGDTVTRKTLEGLGYDLEIVSRGNRGHSRKSRRGNPGRVRRPRGARLIYPDLRIVGTAYGRHRSGGLYKHRYGRGKVRAYALPGGQVMYEAHQGKLWTYA